MEHLKLDSEGPVVRVGMDRPPANALETTLVDELREVFDELESDDGVGGIILGSNVEGFFSAGLDLFEMAEYEEDDMQAFVTDVLKLTLDMLEIAKPLVAALPGHCMAAGAHLAAYADFRLAATGDYNVSYHEVDVGVPVTEPEILPIKDLVGTRIRELFLEGAIWGPEQARDAGLVDELVEPRALDERALAFTAELAEKPSKNYSLIRRELRGRAIELFEERMDEYVQKIMDVVTDPQARAAIAERVDVISP